MSNTEKTTAIGTFCAGVCAFALAVSFGYGAFDSGPELTAQDVQVDEAQPTVVIEPSAEPAVIRVEDLPLEVEPKAKPAILTSGPAAARRRPAQPAANGLASPTGLASQAALNYDPMASGTGRGHAVRSIHARKVKELVGLPSRPMKREKETFVFEVR